MTEKQSSAAEHPSARSPVLRAALLCAAGVFVLIGGLLCLYDVTRFLGVAVGTVGVITGFYASVRRRGVMIAFSALLCVGLLLFLAAELPVLAGAHSDADTDADYLIVCGAGVNGTQPSQSMLERLTAALSWLRDHPDAAVIVSGSQGDCGELVSEAEAMRVWLTDAGIDPDRILMDESAGSTWENLQNALDIIAARGGDPTGCAAVVSSEYHLCRIRMMAHCLGCDAVCIAGHTGQWWLRANYTIREAAAVWKLWLTGS